MGSSSSFVGFGSFQVWRFRGSRLKVARDGGNLGMKMFGFSFAGGSSLLKRQ